MKTYIHARLTRDERATLDELKRVTGESESALVRRGLKLVAAAVTQPLSALELAGESVGRFKGGPRDLSTNPKHLEGYGK